MGLIERKISMGVERAQNIRMARTHFNQAGVMESLRKFEQAGKVWEIYVRAAGVVDGELREDVCGGTCNYVWN